MSHVTHMKESRHVCAAALAMAHLTKMKDTALIASRHNHIQVMSHREVSHVTHTNESCHTYE